MALAVQQMSDAMTANPDLDAIIPVGGWPMFVPGAYKAFVDNHRDKFDSGELSLVVADTLAVQLELLRDGYADGLVGQRPYEPGEKAMDILLALQEGKQVEAIPYAGLSIVTAENVGELPAKN